MRTTVFIPVLQMRRLRHRKEKTFSKGTVLVSHRQPDSTDKHILFLLVSLVFLVLFQGGRGEGGRKGENEKIS